MAPKIKQSGIADFRKASFVAVLAALLCFASSFFLQKTAFATSSATDIIGEKTGSDSNATAYTTAIAPNDDYTDIVFFVLVDKKWVQVNLDGSLYSSTQGDYVKKRINTCKIPWPGETANRMFVTGDVLAGVYGNFRFTVQDLQSSSSAHNQGNLLFANTIAGKESESTIWADRASLYEGDLGLGNIAANWDVPLRITSIAYSNYKKDSYVFYLPRNLPGNSSYFASGKNKTDETLLADNTFYSATVFDEESSGVSEIDYILSGESASFTVKQPTDGMRWVVYSRGEAIDHTEKVNTDGTLALTVSKVENPLVVRPMVEDAASFDIAYQAATLQQEMQSLGQVQFSQKIVQDGSIQGKESLQGSFLYDEDTDEYIVCAPDKEVAITKWNPDPLGKNRQFRYTFVGWKVATTGEIWQPGDKISREEMAHAAHHGGVVELSAQWNAMDESTGRIQTANFYVSTGCEIENTQLDAVKANPTNGFTDSIYTARVLGTEGLGFSPEGLNVQITPPITTSSVAHEVDTQMRACATTPIIPLQEVIKTPYTGQGIFLESFPSDEEILEIIRNGSDTVHLGGEVVLKSDITADNFTVRWFLLKYEQSDGWHIDGVLVAKQEAVVPDNPGDDSGVPDNPVIPPDDNTPGDSGSSPGETPDSPSDEGSNDNGTSSDKDSAINNKPSTSGDKLPASMENTQDNKLSNQGSTEFLADTGDDSPLAWFAVVGALSAAVLAQLIRSQRLVW